MINILAQLLCSADRVLDGTSYYEFTKNHREIKRWKHKALGDFLYKAIMLIILVGNDG